MTDENQNTGSIPPVEATGDRGSVKVGGKKGNKKKFILFVFILFAVIIVIAVVSTVLRKKTVPDDNANQKLQVDETLLTSQLQDRTLSNQMNEIVQKQQRDEAERQRAQQAAIEKARKEKEAQEREAQQKAELERIKHQNDPNDLPPPNIPASSGTGNASGGNDKAPPTPAQRKLQGETLVNLGNSTVKTDEQPQPQSGGIGEALQGESFANSKAGLIGNTDYLLTHGSTLQCVLKTKIVTTYKGVVLCQLAKDVYSANGKTLLLRRGSMFFGEQKVAVTQGQARVFLNWTEVDSPDGVNVRMDSLGTDPLGASGAEAWVDNHWGERFGNSILLSFIDDAFATASNATSGDDSGVSIDNTTSNVESMADKALENSINIPPTAYINQGTMMNILVPRNIDFSSVYLNR
ncbi:TPA: type IV secretion system protein VirB10 [Salmonella enterica]